MTAHVIAPSNPWKNTVNTLMDRKLITEEDQRLFGERVKLAIEELREDDKTKEQCLKQLREWVNQNPDIEYCLTDDIFLLKFLRVKKYSLFMAQQTLLKYLNLRKRFPLYMNKMDYQEDKVNELITNGYIYVSPFRDTSGRRVIIYNIEKFDLNRYTNVDMGHAHTVTYESIVDNEEDQILGLHHVADIKGISVAFSSLFSVSEFVTIIRWGEQSFPMRHKEVDLLNVPQPLRFAYDLLVSNLSKKIKDRFTLHEKLEDLQKKVPTRCLPAELGGTMPMAEMINLWKNELETKRDRLMCYDKMNLLSDKGIISRKNYSSLLGSSTDGESLPGSFRKLEVD